MDFVTLSNKEDRIIKFGLSKPERYADGTCVESDPWWNVHIYIKKPMIEIKNDYESMTECDLIELVNLIEESKTIPVGKEISIQFMEPDYSFELCEYCGILSINLKYCDSLNIWLEREDLESIAEYIKKTIDYRENY